MISASIQNNKPMSRVFVGLLFFCFTITSQAQQDAWIYLADKSNVAASLANPISILSQKAIDRKQNHSIGIDYRDVPVNELYISDLKSQTGITVMAKSKWFNAVHVRGTEDDINALNILTFIESIDFADKNLNTTSRNASVLDAVTIDDQSIVFSYGNTQNQVEMINVDNLHLADFTGQGITIAVIDSGFPNVNTMEAFQRLRDNNGLLGGYDFVNRTSDIYVSTGSNHGTKVLSTMAAYLPNEFIGTAPDASYYLFRTEDGAQENPVEESYWVEAAERADSLGVNMINTSLGYNVFDNSNYNYTPDEMNGDVAFISRGASIAVEKGILVVVSAGNTGATSWQTVTTPGDSPHVLTVGGVNANGNYVSFSSQGGAAQIGYQKPDVVARGGAAYVIDENNNIVQNNGTSFSSPILCGGIAALWQAIPEASPAQVMDYVRQSASQFNAPDNFLGYGIPDLDLARTMALSITDERIDTFGFYPNPVQHTLNIKMPSSSIQMEVSIYNQLGQNVLNRTLTENLKALDVSEFSSGLYLIKLSNSNFSKTLKFIKQ